MTDEEMAEEYANKHTHYEVGRREGGVEYAKKVSNVTIQQAFLAGLKLGRQEENCKLKDRFERAKKISNEWTKTDGVSVWVSMEKLNAMWDILNKE